MNKFTMLNQPRICRTHCHSGQRSRDTLFDSSGNLRRGRELDQNNSNVGSLKRRNRIDCPEFAGEQPEPRVRQFLQLIPAAIN